MKIVNSWPRYWLSIAILLAPSPFLAMAQATSASLNGTVRDSAGAAVNNAEITATATATNATVSTRAHSDGEFTLLNLPVGSYSLRVKAPGFRGYQQTGILLELNQHAAVDVTLQVGDVQQEVTVNADVNTLDLTSATLNSEVNGISISNLPLNTRAAYSMLALVPGFTGGIGNDYNGVSYSIDGGNNQYGDVLVDGTPAGFPTVQGWQGIGVFPSVDAIGEFRILAQSFPAEYGRTLDGVLNVVFKAGANQFHATAFEFNRTKNLAANDYFSNLKGVALPDFHRNQFGGVFDGPLYRNKAFFLVSTELLRQSQFVSTTTTVPTVLQRTGDFSQTFGSDGNLITVYNPFTTALNPNGGGGYIRQAYQNNQVAHTCVWAGRGITSCVLQTS